MNHHWANQYAQQRFIDLTAEAQGDQLVRRAEFDSRDAPGPPRMSAITRLFAKVTAVAGRRVSPAPGSSGR